jgi:hypothetical protein
VYMDKARRALGMLAPVHPPRISAPFGCIEWAALEPFDGAIHCLEGIQPEKGSQHQCGESCHRRQTEEIPPGPQRTSGEGRREQGELRAPLRAASKRPAATPERVASRTRAAR